MLDDMEKFSAKLMLNISAIKKAIYNNVIIPC